MPIRPFFIFTRAPSACAAQLSWQIPPPERKNCRCAIQDLIVDVALRESPPGVLRAGVARSVPRALAFFIGVLRNPVHVHVPIAALVVSYQFAAQVLSVSLGKISILESAAVPNREYRMPLRAHNKLHYDHAVRDLYHCLPVTFSDVQPSRIYLRLCHGRGIR